MRTPHTPPANGMAFIMAPDNGPPPRTSQGSSIGIMDESSEDNVQQLAVELDTCKDIGDIDGNHIAIDTKSVLNSVTAKSLNNIRVNLTSQRNIKVRVDYNSWTNLLEVYAAYASDPLVKVIKLQIDLEGTVPRSIFVGFTASTGSFTERHQLLDWKFTSTVYM
ncbi:truncated lectin 2-like [Tripterygium wilfordii]|uniref:truncated lectin 2-like n=1 Tax=Tripterygium wilfordii TaxID=458696 RepID=UPI0018F85964|nr:truncated lectin 2-like [Tripterygium wilfordii]